MIKMTVEEVMNASAEEIDWWFDNTNEASEARDYANTLEALGSMGSVTYAVSEYIYLTETQFEEQY